MNYDHNPSEHILTINTTDRLAPIIPHVDYGVIPILQNLSCNSSISPQSLKYVLIHQILLDTLFRVSVIFMGFCFTECFWRVAYLT